MSSIPLYVYSKMCLCSIVLMKNWVVFSLEPLRIKLFSTFLYQSHKISFGYVSSFLLEKHLKELLGYNLYLQPANIWWWLVYLRFANFTLNSVHFIIFSNNLYTSLLFFSYICPFASLLVIDIIFHYLIYFPFFLYLIHSFLGF